MLSTLLNILPHPSHMQQTSGLCFFSCRLRSLRVANCSWLCSLGNGIRAVWCDTLGVCENHNRVYSSSVICSLCTCSTRFRRRFGNDSRLSQLSQDIFQAKGLMLALGMVP